MKKLEAMENHKYIPLFLLCKQYTLEIEFVHQLHESDLIQIVTIEENNFLDHDQLGDFEKMIRIHRELHINIEGIDAVFNLLNKIETLKEELDQAKNKLRLYEGE